MFSSIIIVVSACFLFCDVLLETDNLFQVPRPTKSQEEIVNEKTQDQQSNKTKQPAAEKSGRSPVPVALSTIHSINLLQGIVFNSLLVYCNIVFS